MSLRGRRPWQSVVGIVWVCGVDCFAAFAKTEGCHCEECNDVAVYGLLRCARNDGVSACNDGMSARNVGWVL